MIAVVGVPLEVSFAVVVVVSGVTPDSDLGADRQLERPRKWASTGQHGTAAGNTLRIHDYMLDNARMLLDGELICFYDLIGEVGSGQSSIADLQDQVDQLLLCAWCLDKAVAFVYQAMSSQSCLHCRIHFHNLESATNMSLRSLGESVYCVVHSDMTVSFLAIVCLRTSSRK